LDAYNKDEFLKLAERIQKEIANTPEFKKIQEDKENDLPF